MRQQFNFSSNKTPYAFEIEEVLVTAIDALRPPRQTRSVEKMTLAEIPKVMSEKVVAALTIANMAIQGLVVLERTQDLISNKLRILNLTKLHEGSLAPQDLGYISPRHWMFGNPQDTTKDARIRGAEAFWMTSHLCLNHHARLIAQELATNEKGTVMGEPYFLGMRLQAAFFIQSAAGLLQGAEQNKSANILFTLSKNLAQSSKVTLMPGPSRTIWFIKQFDPSIRGNKQNILLLDKLDAALRPYDPTFPGPGKSGPDNTPPLPPAA